MPPDSEPEPDFSIVHNREDDYAASHPSPADIIMVIDVTEASPTYDRDVKLPLYAEARIPNYWLFNLSDRQLETYSQPSQLGPEKYNYLNRKIVLIDSEIALPAFPESPLALNRIFPPPLS